MTFLEMQQDLADTLSAYDETVSADATKLKRWLNKAQRTIAGEWDWDFLTTFDIIQTAADYTTGTCSISAGGSTVTFSGTISTSMTGRFIQFSSADDWYEITAHTAGASTATIDPVYGQTSALSAGTFTIRKVFYSVASTLDSIYNVIFTPTPKHFVNLSPLNADFNNSFLDSTGEPAFYNLSVPSTADGLPRMSFYPTPDGVYNVLVRAKRQVTDLSSDSDVSVFPSAYITAIVHLAAFYGFETLDDTRAKTEYNAYEEAVKKAKLFYSQDKGKHRVMRAIDQADNSQILFTLPSNYGPVSNG